MANDNQKTTQYQGVVIDHGAANYNFDSKEKQNYYIKMMTAQGEKIVWGVDLERASNESRLKVGDPIKLENIGSKSVTVDALKKDELGKVIGRQNIETNRNNWQISPAQMSETQLQPEKPIVQKDFTDKVIEQGKKEFLKQIAPVDENKSLYHIATENESLPINNSSEAGTAFYNYDRTKQPFVIETTVNGGSKLIATSEKIQLQDGTSSFNKVLKNPNEIDPAFVTSYYSTMQQSVEERLNAADWDKIRKQIGSEPVALDQQLKDDFASLAQVDVIKASQIWAKNVPKDIEPPPFVIKDVENHLTVDTQTIYRLAQQRQAEAVSVRSMLAQNYGQTDQVIKEEKKTTNKALDFINKIPMPSMSLGIAKAFAMKNRASDEPSFIKPAIIDKKYIEVDGKHYEKGNERVVVFEDLGTKLKSSSNDKVHIADIVAYAQAKNWDTLQLSGSKEFKREAWLQAESQGLKTKGYTPDEIDKAVLKDLTEKRSINTIGPDLQSQSKQHTDKQLYTPKELSSLHNESNNKLGYNIDTLKKNSAFSDVKVDEMTKIAYWRGIVMEDVKNRPAIEQAEVLDRFDAVAKNPDFIKKIGEQTLGKIEDKTVDAVEKQQHSHKEHELDEPNL